MKKGNLLLKYFLVVMFLPVAGVFAQGIKAQQQTKSATKEPYQRTPVETFIAHYKETNTFKEVSNIFAPDRDMDKTELLKNVARVQPLTINYTAIAELIQKNMHTISLVVPDLQGGTYTIELGQYDILGNEFRVDARGADGEDKKFDYTPGKYFQGVVKGYPRSVAAFSFFKGEVYGIFSIPGVGNMVIEPNTMVGPAYDYNAHYLLYNDKDILDKSKAPKCRNEQLTQPINNGVAARTTTTANNNVYQNCEVINIMEVGDYYLYLSRGSNVANVTNLLTAIFNNEAVIYKNELILINLKYVRVNTASDAYYTLGSSGTASSSDFLNEFGDDVQNTYKNTHGCQLAHLVSTTPGNLGGVAWLNAMCRNYIASSHFGATAFSNISNSTPPSFPTYSWNVEVKSHETGHNFGSQHTQACVWNGNGTAIDGCVTTESGCPDPGDPSPTVGGTIMSYCHLAAAGINFVNGFGPQPGNVIRGCFTDSNLCYSKYAPNTPLQTANRTLSANRECTDKDHKVTYYWWDNNTASQNDDTLILMIDKGTNNIGNLNTPGFSIKAITTSQWGSNASHLTTFPAGMPSAILAKTYSMNRYWTISGATNPTTPVEIFYPWIPQDTNDVHGSVLPAGTLAPLSGYVMYKVNTPIDPNPWNDFPSSVAANFQVYSFGASSSTTDWSLTTSGLTKYARMKTSVINGGGTGAYTYCVPHPAPTFNTLPSPPCPGFTATYSVPPDLTAASFQWTVVGTGWSGTSTSNAITLTAGTGPATITVRAIDSCGIGSGTAIVVTPAPLPIVDVSSTSTMCVGGTSASFTASVVAGAPTSYTWTVIGTGWSGTSTTDNISVTAGTGTAMIIANGTNFCGTGVNDTFYATMDQTAPPTPVTITPPALVCPVSTATFSTPLVTGATSYSWTVSGTGWSGSGSANSLNVTVGTGTGTVSVVAVNGCGSSASYTRVITPNNGPGAATSISAPALPCSGTTISVTTPVVPTANTYTWAVSGLGWSGSGSGTSITATVGTGTGTITVTPSNACGVGLPATTTVEPTPAPTSNFALSSHITSANSDIIAFYTGTAAPGSVFLWNFPGGTGTPGTGSGPQTVRYASPGQYIIFLNVSNGSGCSSSTADTVHVLPNTGLPDVSIEKVGANVVPNPNAGTFELLFSESIAEAVTVKLFDVRGRIVYSNKFDNALNKKVTITTDNLASGTYNMSIIVNDRAIARKVTIVR